MNQIRKAYKLIITGNKNIPSMINSIIAATKQARLNEQNDQLAFSQIHIFHTEQSLAALMTSNLAWKEALSKYNIPPTSFVHQVTDLENDDQERTEDVFEQLKTIINPLENTDYYIDVSSGISALKSILAVFAYVMDIEQVYSLEVNFSSNKDERDRQQKLFYAQLEQEKDTEIKYRKFPPTKQFDSLGKLNYTEVIRHRQLIDRLSKDFLSILPTKIDLGHLQSSLLAGVKARLLGEVTGQIYDYRHSVFSSSAGVEEIADIILSVFTNSGTNDKYLGTKLGEIKTYFEQNPKYFIDSDILEQMSKLLSAVRNDIVHSLTDSSKNAELSEIKAYLASHIAFAFLQFTIRSLSKFSGSDGKLASVEIRDIAEDSKSGQVLYFGFDGDDTGDYLEHAFDVLSETETEIKQKSKALDDALEQMKKTIWKITKNKEAIIFAGGDNILFKARYEQSLLDKLQHIFRNATGLSSSIGYGRTPKETAMALRLAKSKAGDSVIGISLQNGFWQPTITELTIK